MRLLSPRQKLELSPTRRSPTVLLRERAVGGFGVFVLSAQLACEAPKHAFSPREQSIEGDAGSSKEPKVTNHGTSSTDTNKASSGSSGSSKSNTPTAVSSISVSGSAEPNAVTPGTTSNQATLATSSAPALVSSAVPRPVATSPLPSGALSSSALPSSALPSSTLPPLPECKSAQYFDGNACQNIPQQEGTSDKDTAEGLVVDRSGNVWVAGTIHQDQSNSDAVLYKYDASGKKLKTLSVSTSGIENAQDLALDSSGNLWVAGTTRNQNAFAARFASDGTPKGVVEFGTGVGSVKLAAGKSGDVWITTDTLLSHITDSGGTLSVSTGGDFSLGTNLTTGMPPTGVLSASGITVDPDGNPWITGYTETASYVFKGTPDGDVTSSNAKFREFGPGNSRATPRGIIAKGSNVWIFGSISKSRFDDNDTSVPSTGFGGTDSFIVRISASDALPHESIQFGDSGSESPVSGSLDSNGDLWIGGQSDFNFGGKVSNGSTDVFAMRFTIPSGAGKPQATSESYLIGSGQPDRGGYVALDTTGHLWLAGSTEGQFLGGTVNFGLQDIFVMNVAK